ncbi:MAG TPA: VanZ family protein, partial [Bacillota bacterium]|nr:VanZ family protein [Bacillota bacterium]
DEGLLHTLVRKAAHLSLYFVLGTLTYIGGWFNIRSTCKTIIMTLAVSIGYAFIDEFHQYFVPGRSCELRDVLIDSAGALIGTLVCLGVQEFYKKRSGKAKA